MKKILTTIFCLSLLLTDVIADVNIGIRGKIGATIIPMSEEVKTGIRNYYKYTTLTSNQYPLFNGGEEIFIEIQSDKYPVGFFTAIGNLFNNGLNLKYSFYNNNVYKSENEKITFSTFEIPLQIEYIFNKNNKFEISPKIGLNLSFPISDLYSNEMPLKGHWNTLCIPGFIAAIDFDFNILKNLTITTGLTITTDFNELKYNNIALGKRTNVFASVGIKYTFNKKEKQINYIEEHKNGTFFGEVNDNENHTFETTIADLFLKGCSEDVRIQNNSSFTLNNVSCVIKIKERIHALKNIRQLKIGDDEEFDGYEDDELDDELEHFYGHEGRWSSSNNNKITFQFNFNEHNKDIIIKRIYNDDDSLTFEVENSPNAIKPQNKAEESGVQIIEIDGHKYMLYNGQVLEVK